MSCSRRACPAEPCRTDGDPGSLRPSRATPLPSLARGTGRHRERPVTAGGRQRPFERPSGCASGTPSIPPTGSTPTRTSSRCWAAALSSSTTPISATPPTPSPLPSSGRYAAWRKCRYSFTATGRICRADPRWAISPVHTCPSLPWISAFPSWPCTLPGRWPAWPTRGLLCGPWKSTLAAPFRFCLTAACNFEHVFQERGNGRAWQRGRFLSGNRSQTAREKMPPIKKGDAIQHLPFLSKSSRSEIIAHLPPIIPGSLLSPLHQTLTLLLSIRHISKDDSCGTTSFKSGSIVWAIFSFSCFTML